jgi:ribosomal protein S28E/S33
MAGILRDIAHVRTGDKGDISQIAVIALRNEDYPRLIAAVTPEGLRPICRA